MKVGGSGVALKAGLASQCRRRRCQLRVVSCCWHCTCRLLTLPIAVGDQSAARTKEVKEAITLGADIGGLDAAKAATDHIRDLRSQLRANCLGAYSAAFPEIALVVRVDGSIQAWGISGVRYVFLRKKHGYATADIFIPKSVWDQPNAMALREHLSDGVREAVSQIIERAKKQRLGIDSDTLCHDVEMALSKYAASAPNFA